MRETDLTIKRLQKDIAEIYRKAYNELSEKFTVELKEYERLNEKYKRSLDPEEYKRWKRSEAAKIAAMKNQQDQYAAIVVNADKVAAELINDRLLYTYANEFNYGTFQIEAGLMVDTSFSLYDEGTVKRLLRDNPNLLPAVDVKIPKAQRWSRKHIASAITQGIIQGEPVQKIANRLEQAVGMSMNAAIRNARTAVTGAENAGHLDSYGRAKAKGLNIRKKWQATYDSRTRHSHAVIDGETVDIEENFSNGCFFPGDPEGPAAEIYNCRCALVPVLKGHERSEAWKDEMTIDGLSYSEWKSRVKRNTDKSLEKSESIKKEILEKAENSKFKGVARDAKNGTGSYMWKNSKAVPAETMRNMGEYSFFDRDGNTVVYGILDNKQVFYANKTDSTEIKELQEIYQKRKQQTYAKAGDITLTPTATYDRWKKRHDDNFAAWFGKDRLK